MNIFIYSDESGVFGKYHNDYFVFAGLIFLSKEEKDDGIRLYHNAENTIRYSKNFNKSQELKACFLKNEDKYKLFRSLNKFYKFGVVVEQNRVYDKIFDHKKTKQRYLDYAYKIAVKNCLKSLIAEDIISPIERHNLYFYIDEHSTATNGRYELQQSLEEEFKIGTINFEYNIFYNPIFPNLNTLSLKFCDSKTMPLIRAADIIANKLYHKATKKEVDDMLHKEKFYITILP